MQTALDFAAYALGATLLVGVLLLGMLAYDLWLSDRFRTPHPSSVRLPCTALEAAREVYDRMKLAYAKVSAQERRHLDVHLRRMGERVRYVEDKTFTEQDPYYKSVARREKQWRGWKALHAQVRQMSRPDRKRSQHLLDDAASGYRKADEAVKEQWERGLYRDKAMHEELRALGLLDDDTLPKLLAQVRAHMAHAPAEPEGWQEPGLEPELEPGLEPAVDAGKAGGVEPGLEDEASALETIQAANDAQETTEDNRAPASALAHGTALAHGIALARVTAPPPTTALAPRHGIGRLGADKIREFLAPLFRRKSPSEQAPAVPVTADAEASPGAWQPAPPPPRVEPPAPQVAGTAVGVPAGAVAPATEPVVLRQQDVQGAAFAAPGRRYADAAFSVAGLPSSILRQADLSGSSFAGVRFTGRHRYLDCRFTGADLSRIELESQSRPHQFVRCDFSGAQFGASRLFFALFHECDLSGSRWTGARLERVHFSDCKLDGVDWDGAELIETQVPGRSSAASLAPGVPDAAPGGTVLNATVPDGTIPAETVPGNSVSSGAVPGGTVPDTGAPAQAPAAPAPRSPAPSPAPSAAPSAAQSAAQDAPLARTPPADTRH